MDWTDNLQIEENFNYSLSFSDTLPEKETPNFPSLKLESATLKPATLYPATLKSAILSPSKRATIKKVGLRQHDMRKQFRWLVRRSFLISRSKQFATRFSERVMKNCDRECSIP